MSVYIFLFSEHVLVSPLEYALDECIEYFYSVSMC